MLILKKELFEEIVAHCISELPNEACGILSGKEGLVDNVYKMSNTSKSPLDFFMDSKEQLKVMKAIRNSASDFIGIYHSHVGSQAYPSAHDIELAFYPEVSYVIVSLKDKDNPSIRSFKIKDNIISEEKVKIE